MEYVSHLRCKKLWNSRIVQRKENNWAKRPVNNIQTPARAKETKKNYQMFSHAGKQEYLICWVYEFIFISSLGFPINTTWNNGGSSFIGKKYSLNLLDIFANIHGSYDNLARQRKRSPFWMISVCKNKDCDLMAAIFAWETTVLDYWI